MEIKIAIAYHKPAHVLSHTNYLPIHVGKQNNLDLSLNIQGDNEGDNISNENVYYCELTAIYWLWKNSKAEIKGLFHYRRILVKHNSIKLYIKRIKNLILKRTYAPTIRIDNSKFINYASEIATEIPILLENYDILTTIPARCEPNLKEYFSRIDIQYLNLLVQAIKSLYPEKIQIFEQVLNNKQLYFGNISIMKSSIFNEYCEFMFTVLSKVKEILITEGFLYDLTKEKIFCRKLGYLGELLTNFFIQEHKHNYKIKELPVAFLK